jgi:ribosomal subunit interface protein
MNVIVQSKTMVITEAMRAFVLRQARKLFQRRQRITQVVVFLENVRRKKNDTTAATAKFFIDIPGKNLVVQERAHDVYLAISNAAKATMRRLRKTKERRLLRVVPVQY